MSALRIVAWIVPLALVALVIALVRREPAATISREPAAATPSDVGFPRTLTMPDGGAVTIARAPRRIVVANTALVDAVVALVGLDRLAALPRQAATWSTIARSAADRSAIPVFDAFVAEPILALEPDLVLCSAHSQPESIAVLRSVGVPTIRFGFPERLADVRAQLRVLAELTGAESRLAALEAELDARIDALRRSAATRAARRAMFYTHDGSEGWSSGSGTIADEILALAGLCNATAAAGHIGPVRLTFEQLLAIDPEVLIVPEAFGEVDASTDRVLLDEPALSHLRAVASASIVHLHPSLFSTTSHEAVTAAEELVRAVAALPARAGEHR